MLVADGLVLDVQYRLPGLVYLSQRALQLVLLLLELLLQLLVLQLLLVVLLLQLTDRRVLALNVALLGFYFGLQISELLLQLLV